MPMVERQGDMVSAYDGRALFFPAKKVQQAPPIAAMTGNSNRNG